MKKKVLLLGAILFAFTIKAQEFVLFQEISEKKQIKFGTKVYISDNYLIVSDTSYKLNSIHGQVFIYKRKNDNTWINISRIENPEAEKFGKNVLICQNYAFISTYSEENIGKIWVYKRYSNNYTLHQKITSNSPQAGSKFGYSMSLDTNNMKLAVGAPDYNSKGCVYIFDFNQDEWVQSKMITEQVQNYNSNFGYSLKISDDKLVVGSPYEKYFDDLNGRAYLYSYKKNNWELKQILLPEYHQYLQYVGYDVDMINNEIFISAPGYNNSSGCVYIFRKNDKNDEYVLNQTLYNPSSNVDDFYGCAISANSDFFAAGCLNDNVIATSSKSGSCFIYKKNNNWKKIQKIYPDLYSENTNYFGVTLKMTNNTLLVGMPGNKSQKAYVYNLPIPFITKHPDDKNNISSHSEIFLTTNAERGENYIWQTTYNNGKSFVNLKVNSNFLNINSDTLSVFATNILNNYKFRCKVSNEYGNSITDVAQLKVNYDSQIAKMYPNPNRGKFKIKFFDNYEGYTAIVYDIRKNILFKTELENDIIEVDIGVVQPGIYILSLVKDAKKEYHKFIAY